MRIYHNPRCKKSRETLQLIQSKGKEPEVVEYLKTPPDKEQLRAILQKLGIKAEDLIRKGEKIYKEQYKGKEMREEDWLDAMVENPVLIERPVVVEGNQAIIGRPPENVEALL